MQHNQQMEPFMYSLLTKLLVLALIINFSAFSKTLVEDPNQLMSKVDQFLGHRSFEQVLNCDLKASFHTPIETCEFDCQAGPFGGNMCMSMCQSSDTVSEFGLTSCTESEVILYSETGYFLPISKDQYNRFSGNLLQVFMSQLGEFISYPGVIKLDKIQPTQYTVGRGTSHERKVDSLNIWGEYHFSEMPGSVEVIFSVAKDVPGVAQVLRFRIDGQTWFRLKDY
jgi:hypothetical protein